ncbi:SLC13 family permease [Aureibacillus halotolerans]|uniref:SLC13 family permease n=1 Tax=Aureibacillus halotolerans TaxID=1508390 RepID=UPI001AAC891D|nr:DASS family sodium-coupled anion symporter [Aureibacillus halotolerans]
MKSTALALWSSLWRSHAQTKHHLRFYKLQFSKSTIEHGKPGASSTSLSPTEKEKQPKPNYSKPQLIGLLLGPLLFVLTLLFFHPTDLSPEGRAVLASTLWIATWWVTEAIPIPATSLLPILLLPLTGAMESDAVFSSYGDDIIFLFLGGFFIATAMEKWDLHKRIALSIISWIGTSTNRIIFGFMLATGFLSMWVSNTAATMMMIPIGLAMVYQVSQTLKGEEHKTTLKKFEKAIIFGIGYSGTIGGLGTLIGTPPNIILAGTAQNLFDVEISFAGFMAFAAPLSIILILFTWFFLTRIVYKVDLKQLPGGKEVITKELSALGRVSFEEKIVLTVFCFAATMWVTRTFLWESLIPGITDGMIAVTATILLFLIPRREKSGEDDRILSWKDSKEIPWGILLLFGGGLAIAAGFSESGLSDWLGNRLSVLDGMNIIIIIAATTLLILFLTEITSNTATATMIMPVVAALALALNIHPFALMVPGALAANCAFMLPVGTPPNAIIFGTGKITIADMVKNGFWLNIIAAALIIFAVTVLLPIMWGIDLNSVPENFR